MSIKISNEERKRAARQPPPANLLLMYQPGDEIEILKAFIEGKRLYGKGDFDFYVSSIALNKILEHCLEMAREGLEAMGFLIGDIGEWEGKIFSVVKDTITSELEASSIHVRFKREAFEKIADQLDELGYDYIILGWYHSHLNYSCFMSDIDMETQLKIFNKPFHAAIVIDPINMEMKVFRILNSKCTEIPFAIFEE